MLCVECTGAPRDLGYDQGHACAAEVARALPLGPAGTDAARVERDFQRHYPHLAERSSGLARGAGVSRRALAAALTNVSGRDAGILVTGGVAIGIDGERSGRGACLVRVLTPATSSAFTLRRSRPDHGYASLEVTTPWLASCLAGVNEEGLAITVTSFSGVTEGRCRAPALLLAQDSLQRCDGAEKALDWCLRRPMGGRATLLFCDADGAQLGLFVDGDMRKVLHPSDGLLLAMESGSRHATLDKALREALVLDGVALQRIFDDAHDGLVWLDPERRRLGLLSGAPADAEPDGVRYLEV